MIWCQGNQARNHKKHILNCRASNRESVVLPKRSLRAGNNSLERRVLRLYCVCTSSSFHVCLLSGLFCQVFIFANWSTNHLIWIPFPNFPMSIKHVMLFFKILLPLPVKISWTPFPKVCHTLELKIINNSIISIFNLCIVIYLPLNPWNC